MIEHAFWCDWYTFGGHCDCGGSREIWDKDGIITYTKVQEKQIPKLGEKI